jgi:uncharacterized membrane-anchored protein YhcB (DUF1043 family)
MKDNHYSVNEILSAIDNLLGSQNVKITQNQTKKEMNEILSVISKIHSKQVSEKFNKTALVLKKIIKDKEVLLLKNFFTTNNPLILK